FAALLDHKKGGSFKIEPLLGNVRRKQLYIPDSNILLTRFLSNEGVAEISDFMPITGMGHACDVVRRVKTVRGDVRYRMIFDPRFDYGRAEHRIQKTRDGALFVSRGPDQTVLRLRSEVPLRFSDGRAIAEFGLGAGDCAAFILEDGRGRDGSP